MSKKLNPLFETIKLAISDFIANSIATWKFIILYTCLMITWIILHLKGILGIDSKDFIKYNLFLSWMAGIQASIVLMASNRQTEKDRETLLKGLDLDKKTLDILNKSDIKKIASRLSELTSKIEKLEEVINLMESEEDISDEGKE